MLILIDLDGPLADFDQGFLNRWKKLFPEEPFIEPENRRLFDVREEYPKHLKEKVESIYRAPGFYLELPLVIGGQEAIQELQLLAHDIYFCTSPVSTPHCIPEKQAWVLKHFGADFARKTIFAKDKTLVRGDILIDDRPGVDGAHTPVWEHIIFDKPYNGQVKDKRRLDWRTWKNVIG